MESSLHFPFGRICGGCIMVFFFFFKDPQQKQSEVTWLYYAQKGTDILFGTWGCFKELLAPYLAAGSIITWLFTSQRQTHYAL